VLANQSSDDSTIGFPFLFTLSLMVGKEVLVRPEHRKFNSRNCRRGRASPKQVLGCSFQNSWARGLR